MTKLPKKITERFKNIARFQKVLQIAKDRDVNESDTVSILNDILGEVFGYDKYLEITSEFAIRGTYCDLAIKIGEKIEFLIEAKAIGIDLKEQHVKQAIDYGANHGVQWVILTNGIEWRIYRIRFEKPINFDLVCNFNFLELNQKDENTQERLFLICKEGLAKNSRDDYFDKVQIVNRYVIGNLILTEAVISTIRRELRKLADGLKVETTEVERIVRMEVLKREIIEGDEAESASARVTKFYKKNSTTRKPTKTTPQATPAEPNAKPEESVTERLLREAEEENN
jgi:predicted type IV restriction endonuclease